jgi:cell division topological specificity factor
VKLFDLFRRSRGPQESASQAKQRLQVLLTLERASMQGPDFLPLMQKELLEVIRKYIEIDEKKLKIEFEREQDISMLAVSIELPNQMMHRPV